MCLARGAGQGPTCTEGTDVLVHLEAHDGAVVINDVRLSIPGTGDHLLVPVALKKARDRDAGVARSRFILFLFFQFIYFSLRCVFVAARVLSL